MVLYRRPQRGHGRGPRSRTRGASASPKGRSQSAGRGGGGIDQMVQAPREFGRRQACSGREVYVLRRPPPQPDRGEPVCAVDMGQAADETLAIRRNWKIARRIDVPVAMLVEKQLDDLLVLVRLERA